MYLRLLYDGCSKFEFQLDTPAEGQLGAAPKHFLLVSMEESAKIDVIIFIYTFIAPSLPIQVDQALLMPTP